HVAPPDQPVPELAVVVDLAVEDDRDGAVFVGDGLAAAAQVDDAEPPHAEADAVGREESVLVRAATRDRRGHPAGSRQWVRARHGAGRARVPGYPAHQAGATPDPRESGVGPAGGAPGAKRAPCRIPRIRCANRAARFTGGTAPSCCSAATANEYSSTR